MNIFAKVWIWILANGASVLSMVQVGIKLVKEIITALLNFLSILFPSSKMQEFVLKARELINSIDEIVEKIKAYLIPKV